ncbi:MAG: AlbA family DNA-binding domain-containing protein [Mycobacteriales bacterium]
MKTVAAFATGDGGDIVFGVDRDEITVVGLTLDNAIVQRDRLYQLVRDRITPAPVVEVTPYDWDGKNLMVLSVPAGLEPPYALAGQTPRFFVRRGTHTCPARPDEIRHAILSRQPATDDGRSGIAALGIFGR